MGQLDLPDVLVSAGADDGDDAFAFFSDLLTYLGQRGSPLPDGDTVGRTETERLHVRYEPSPIHAGVDVCRVDLP